MNHAFTVIAADQLSSGELADPLAVVDEDTPCAEGGYYSKNAFGRFRFKIALFFFEIS